MADEPEVEEQVLEVEETPVEPEAPEAETPEEETDEEETIVSFGDPEEDQSDDGNSTVRQMRARIRELEREVKARESVPAKVEAMPEPTLESCDYDEDKFKADWRKWNQEQETVKVEQAKAEEENRRVQQEWEADLHSYAQKKQSLAIPDIAECEESVAATLSNVQQAVVIKAASDSALFMVALAKSPAKLAEIAKIQDPVKLAAAVARMEGGIKVVKRRKGPALDVAQRGSAAIPAVHSSDKKLEQLEKEAERTGNRTELRKYRKWLKKQGK